MKPSPGFNWAVPESLNIPPDPLRARLDFHNQACVLSIFDGDVVETYPVDMRDVAHALASELSFSTGLLPDGALWWSNTSAGPVYAIYQEPKIWKVALQERIDKPPRRFTIPLPGLIFLCSPGIAPWVYAVKKKPTKLGDIVYEAPLCNIFENGRSCPGNNKYPTEVGEIVDSFFRSFFTASADLRDRSVKFPATVVHLWEFLNGKKQYPMEDLVKHGTVLDLMRMEIRG